MLSTKIPKGKECLTRVVLLTASLTGTVWNRAEIATGHRVRKKKYVIISWMIKVMYILGLVFNYRDLLLYAKFEFTCLSGCVMLWFKHLMDD